MNYDLLIVAHEKDYDNLEYVIDYSYRNLSFDELHLIISDREDYNLDRLNFLNKKNIYKHRESEIIKIQKERIKYRPNWTYQQLLKLFQNVTTNENYVVLDADCLIMKPLDFLEGDKNIFYLSRNQNHKPYFNFIKKIIGYEKEFQHSFISEIMMMNKKVTEKFLFECGCQDVSDFLNLIYENIDSQTQLSEYEMYGTYFYKNFKNKFISKHLNFRMFGKYNTKFTSNEIKKIIEENKNLDLFTIHNWID